MKPTLLIAMLSLGFAAPKAYALSELETLRVKCGEQERQIRRLEEENAKLRSGKTAPSSAVSKPEEKPTAQASGRTHKLEEGETYSSISRKYKIPVASLIAANPDAKPTALRGGQIIRLPGSTASATPAKASEPPSRQKSETPVTSACTKPKSTTPSTAAPAARKSAVSSTIPVSMVKETPAAPKTNVDEPEVTDTTPSQKHSSSPNPEKKIRSVKIEGETTYGEFAAKHGTDTGRLNDLNGLDLTNATVLAKGSELYVPAQP